MGGRPRDSKMTVVEEKSLEKQLTLTVEEKRLERQ